MKHRQPRCAFAVLMCTLWLGCVREDSAHTYHIRRPRILAVLSDPAEAAPGETVHYRALVVDETGPLDSARVHWSFCLTPRALTENTSVSTSCAEHDEQPLAERTLELDAIIPRDACARFGSETSLGQRPLDPDRSGGYYQPLRLSGTGLDATIVRQRIACPLANAPIAVAQRFAGSYVRNRAPSLGDLTLHADGETLSRDALPARTRIALSLELGDDARESYPLYDALSGRLSTRGESLRAQWFVTQGALAQDENAVPELRAENTLTTPEEGESIWLWIVVRDDRGGVSALERQLTIAE